MVKMVKISSIFVAFLENMNFTNHDVIRIIWYQNVEGFFLQKNFDFLG